MHFVEADKQFEHEAQDDLTFRSTVAYTAALQTAALRMIIDGYRVSEIRFDPPQDLGNRADRYIFSAQGGSANYRTADKKIMANGEEGLWIINADFSIPEKGTAAPDIIAFIPNVSKEFCLFANKEAVKSERTDFNPVKLGANYSVSYHKSLADKDTRETSSSARITATSEISKTPILLPASLSKRAFGCVQNGGDSEELVYFHVILEL